MPVSPQDDPEMGTGYNSYGAPGLIDMPVATSPPDAELAFTTSSFAGQTRNTLTFQMTPRLSGSFRYSVLDDFLDAPGGSDTLYDRSLSLHYRFMDEDVAGMRPAIAIGSGGFTNPLSVLGDRFERRPDRDANLGGEVEADQLFRGDAAFFGGMEWQVTDKLKLIAEYSSDDYQRESRFAFDPESQLNFGATYTLRPGIDLSLRYLYGSEIGVQLSAALNPLNRPYKSGRAPAPPPVMPQASAAALSWGDMLERQGSLRQQLSDALNQQGIRLHGFELNQASIRVDIENKAYLQQAQAIGRTARVLSRRMPARIETFSIVSVASGMPVSEIRIRRSDMETLEHEVDGSWQSFARAQIASPVRATQPVPERYPNFDWSLKPYLTPSLFDPDDPLRADVGAEISARYEPLRGLEFSGSIRKKVIGNLDEATRRSDSVLPRVRSDFSLYDKEGDPALTDLTAGYYFKPGKNLYGRATVGYLERMFGGVSTELLWKPNDSFFAIGIETSYVKQRDFDQGFGFQDYDVVTGHVSAYSELGNGFHAQVDAGRYLAGDWGATFSLDREFKNGWRVGAFATKTDVSSSDFGEGSFDKGIRITVPLSWLTGEPNRDGFSTTIRPVTRDGGARLDVDGRLYDRVRPLQKPALQDGWGRFWR
ncbi:MAG: YjbH domain-containing protein [Loktanella sp.]|nr:YjbH domain-containing protein [Loktanella sp.]